VDSATDLATDLIRLSGLEPDVDIDIHFTGIRPGEKLFEELFFKGDHVTPTEHPKILRARDAESPGESDEGIERLIRAAQENRPSAEIRRSIVNLVPEYTGQLDTGEFALGRDIPSFSDCDESASVTGRERAPLRPHSAAV